MESSSCFPIITPLFSDISSSSSKASVQRETSSSNKNKELNNAESTQYLSCPFSRSGCETIMKEEDFENHKLDCKFSYMNFCPYLGIRNCNTEIEYADLLEHLELKHSVKILTVNVNTSVQVHQSGDLANKFGIFYWNPICIIYEGTKFFFRTTIFKKNISWHVSALASIATAEKFTATITILSHRDASLKWKGQVLSIRECDEEFPSFTLPIDHLGQMSSRRDKSDVDEWQLQILIEKKSTQYTSDSTKIIFANPLTKSESDLNETKEDIARHRGYECDGCSMDPIVGIRYKCMKCKDYDLCRTCMDLDRKSHADHIFLRIPKHKRLRRSFNSLAVVLSNGHVTFDIDSQSESESEEESDEESEHEGSEESDSEADD